MIQKQKEIIFQMATGQNNNGNPNHRNPKIPSNQPAKRRRKKEKVPGAVIMIYVLTVLLVLSICALVFVITLNKTGWNGKNPGEDDSLEVSISSDISSGDSDNTSGNTSDVSSDSDSQSSTGDSSDSSSSTSSTSSSTSSSSSSASTSSTSSGGGTALPMDYNADFFKDDLFIGDSIFTGLYLYGFLDQANVAAAVGYTPYKAMHSAFGKNYSGSATDYATERAPKRIFIMLGSNTMAAGTNFDMMVTQYETMLNSLEQNCPNSKIYVISIPPVTSDSSAAASANINNSDITSVNSKLKKMAGSVGVEYFDFNNMLSDDNGYFMKDYAELDGLHFKGATYKVLLSALERTAGA